MRSPGAGGARAAVVAAVVAARVAAACGDGPADAPRIAGARPDYGPLVGGAMIAIAGAGFASRGEPMRVLIGGREAPLATALDDSTLQVVIPSGDRPGDAELVVLTDRGNARATGVFHYSAPPAIAAIAPAEVLFSSSSTRIAITGSGFLDEGAGEVEVALDGQLATDVIVESDTQLSFTAPAGRAFAEPGLVIADGRGTATRARGLRYVPSMRGGLLLFPKFSSLFAIFFDPVDNSAVLIPWAGAPVTRFTAVVRDERGTYWGFDRGLLFGRLDLGGQRLEAPIQIGRLATAAARVGSEYYALDRFALRFGRIDPLTGAFTTIGSSSIPCCGSYGLAWSGTALYLAARQGTQITLNTIDPATGALGTPVAITAPPGFHVEDMRFFAGRLYATSRDSTLAVIDPVSGVATVLPVSLGRSGAMEVFEPAQR
jgi:IPT/TIG domain-containing protein